MSYNDVKRAAMALLEAGQEPSVRSVLVTLGTGRNMGRVAQDLRRWRQETLLALQNLDIQGLEEVFGPAVWCDGSSLNRSGCFVQA